jgi:hydrogenase maturation protein HypF
MYLDYIKGIDRGIIAARFHNTIVKFTTEMLLMMRDKYHINKVVLSGGCFQNRYLLEELHARLQNCGFELFVPRRIPANDGGISLGQAVIAIEQLT